MNGLLVQLGITVRLHYRNRMALIYSYLFPTIFLLAFWVLYRHEPVPLAGHMGELLTVTVLGGACFGLPTALVSERERGVWRRYRLVPVPIASVVASTVIARYLLLISAGLLQLGLAMGTGMPAPEHPLGLWLAFTVVAFAFIGLGLVIATLADNVPAVQALGQCIFLPMLIIGGVAVRLENLPVWAQHLSGFFPGRYAVEAIQAAVTGDGVEPARLSLMALVVIGVAACIAGSKMFRWDAGERFATRGDKGWVAVALVAWLAVGLVAEAGGYAVIVGPSPDARVSGGATSVQAASSDAPVSRAPGGPASATTPAGALDAPADDRHRSERSAPATSPDSTPAETASRTQTASQPAPAGPQRWQDVELAELDADLFEDLPPDAGLVTPIAAIDEPPHAEVASQLTCLRAVLPGWGPGRVVDPVQGVRNNLYIAAVPDMYRMEALERWVPLIVFDRLKQDVPRDDLGRI
ncbi:MAG: ABC transporter permease, partial [Longimicrobiales bacterium]